ncbi:Acidic endochitinase SP2 [Cucumispora dikerogammari]|nr:Acidic endochitinase SP2 [Cucumispora dikerogammari]
MNIIPMLNQTSNIPDINPNIETSTHESKTKDLSNIVSMDDIHDVNLDIIQSEQKHYKYEFTKEKITECVEACGFKPNSSYVKVISENIQDIKETERAMFLAQIIHETIGLTEIEELGFKGKKSLIGYTDALGKEGKSYHGRGFIQLTGTKNYQKAGEYLKIGDFLLENPEKVCEDLDLAWKVTAYYWNEWVSTHFLVQKKMFWATTFSINGPLECDPVAIDPRAQMRWDNYEKVSTIMGEFEKANKGLDELNQAIMEEQSRNKKEEVEVSDKSSCVNKDDIIVVYTDSSNKEGKLDSKLEDNKTPPDVKSQLDKESV